MLTNSLWPPRSHIEKVISVFRIDMVFSMKLTPAQSRQYIRKHDAVDMLTQGLDIVLIPAAFDVFHHERCLANLSVTDHADLDDNATLRLLLPLAGCVRALSRRTHAGAGP